MLVLHSHDILNFRHRNRTEKFSNFIVLETVNNLVIWMSCLGSWELLVVLASSNFYRLNCCLYNSRWLLSVQTEHVNIFIRIFDVELYLLLHFHCFVRVVNTCTALCLLNSCLSTRDHIGYFYCYTIALVVNNLVNRLLAKCSIILHAVEIANMYKPAQTGMDRVYIRYSNLLGIVNVAISITLLRKILYKHYFLSFLYLYY